jgi:hypothetical protein
MIGASCYANGSFEAVIEGDTFETVPTRAVE